MFGVVAAPLSFSPHQTRPSPPADYREDPRLQSLRSFFGKGNCPAKEFAEAFLQAADKYDLDWRLLPSLSWVESTGGKLARNNNFFGWDSGKAEFTSVTAGIHAVGYRLANSSLYKNKGLDELLATYNPDVEYAPRVKAVMRRISAVE